MQLPIIYLFLNLKKSFFVHYTIVYVERYELKHHFC